MIVIADYIAAWPKSPFGALEFAPWHLTSTATELISNVIRKLGTGYCVTNDVAIHATANIEDGAVIKGPAIIGPGSFIARTAYVRGGCFLQEDCIIGPGAELKTCFMFRGSKLAHLNFVGDSLLGSDVNIEAGAIVANYRNELEDKTIRIETPKGVIDTGVQKFGAVLGDGARVGANAVIAPGAILEMGARVARLGHVDQMPSRL